MKKLVFCLLALTPAFALASPGPYASVQAGVNWVDPGSDWMNGGTKVTSQNDSVGMAAGAGVGYLWGDNNINYGLEVDALSYPDSNSQPQDVSGTHYDVKYDGYNISLLAVLKYTSCSTGFTMFVKGGGAYVNQQLHITDNSPSVNISDNDDDFAPEAAVGVGYMLAPNLEADVTYDEVFAGSQRNIDIADLGGYDPDGASENRNFLFGLAYHFS